MIEVTSKLDSQEFKECENKKLHHKFINANGRLQAFKLGKDYLWHSYMNREEWLKRNDKKELKKKKKCSMWNICRNQEYTITTSKNIKDKIVDEITKHIDKEILENILEKKL